jgi:hypothetical protein
MVGRGILCIVKSLRGQFLWLIFLSHRIKGRMTCWFFIELWKHKGGHGGWIYNYLCNQCLSPLKLWVRISIRARCTTLCDKICQWLATAVWISLGPPVSSTNKTERHDITEILLKVALKTIKQTNRTLTICTPI